MSHYTQLKNLYDSINQKRPVIYQGYLENLVKVVTDCIREACDTNRNSCAVIVPDASTHLHGPYVGAVYTKSTVIDLKREVIAAGFTVDIEELHTKHTNSVLYMIYISW